MNVIPKPVFILNNGNWQETEFVNLKAGDIFTFNKQNVFTASFDAYLITDDSNRANTWSIFIINKELEQKPGERQEQWLKSLGF